MLGSNVCIQLAEDCVTHFKIKGQDYFYRMIDLETPRMSLPEAFLSSVLRHWCLNLWSVVKLI